jgi:hypothetical protein
VATDNDARLKWPIPRVGVVVGVAPPAPVVETVPAPPGPGYVWQPGYWSWNGVQVGLGARHIRRGPLRSCGMGSRSLDQAWPRLGVGRWSLAALAGGEAG